MSHIFILNSYQIFIHLTILHNFSANRYVNGAVLGAASKAVAHIRRRVELHVRYSILLLVLETVGAHAVVWRSDIDQLHNTFFFFFFFSNNSQLTSVLTKKRRMSQTIVPATEQFVRVVGMKSNLGYSSIVVRTRAVQAELSRGYNNAMNLAVGPATRDQVLVQRRPGYVHDSQSPVRKVVNIPQAELVLADLQELQFLLFEDL
jgi:hypothetical protein